ncbi:phosphoribosylformimino-5-aminoimidazole carboxamide ribotide isomerase [Marchantia polymorpha subsp. ruderalis]|uniref:1-(5-phosphoribosyl)-5-[(5-phosphoribosylamino)methylideneamino] imidazole-4-carboxamide isomerase HISN3, chloroplastic n=2 Tax=Marchantia polymorpha TaxID=3197 RepID=A0AAF6B8F9_MARPO|nr:hypothetical protein MARPO_0011s0027 [Marchantia polymorpha]PTQ46329.1 hypothetical protein MARPO_0011s0027 [Marchantia polymorpha]BBN08292.1 hypothetical protein Mp_4g10400 [Marchantia polymorpha subsp. ruderalis]BBN08293.1 hypothetical protein Mp_4g10400 [Marchantia polymorpha subsp. ruderalis]|eukprot:PTQ46328.1 hypothetical protein MARPO_0011s0027 [Marchantia polymorpha]
MAASAGVAAVFGSGTIRSCFTFGSTGRRQVIPGDVVILKMRTTETGVGVSTGRKQGVIFCSASSLSTTEKTKDRAVTFRPCIDIHQGKVKQIVGSTLAIVDDPASEDSVNGEDLNAGSSLVTNFVSEQSAAYFAKLYKSHKLKGGHVIALSKDEASEVEARKALGEYPGGLQFGGGVNPENAERYLEYGASHVIVTSYIFSQGELDLEKLQKLVTVVGKDKLVLDLSCRKKDGQYFVVTDRWQRFSNFVVNKDTLEELGKYADEFLVHGVDVEGKRLGVDEELVRLLGENSPIPVTYAGGVSSMKDLDVIIEAGGGKVHVTVGSGLDIFGGSIPYSDVLNWHYKNMGKKD